MKNQIIQNVFKLMLGTSALLVSVAFFIRTISPVQASNSDKHLSPELIVNSGTSIPVGTIVGCGSGIYQYKNMIGGFEQKWVEVGPE
jgi:hypothetical protein